ncbi:2-oxoglutarate-Fe(II) type oxidoreductase hxnY-like [Dioscorea cayenensis subsp. rotundata]|uniref:2-oxoglutarate-Fe(II) type oxidoreductase hxnY-like n=1 Tax=Dioscorea cayennensis subsp. rotundata TaxID=55577 RepID=A0AB40CN91_DIOCR|nr:2-oxoglutarate-Fe(II) type oxidoreductase hxnY-like [Dioscorea cayenensis subsp. rotundata]
MHKIKLKKKKRRKKMAGDLALPLIDLVSPDLASTAKSIRKACVDYGFFYLVNHGIEESFFQQVFNESKKFFSLPLDQKMKLKTRKDNRGYNPLPSVTLDSPPKVKGATYVRVYYISSSKISHSQFDANQWPPEELLPCWKAMMESYYEKMLAVSKKLISLMALSLGLDDLFFEKIGALHEPLACVRLLHYPVSLFSTFMFWAKCFEESCGRLGVSAHSDFGMVTLLLTDGVRGLQICRDKDSSPQLWEDVPHVHGALVVNVGDMLERWTNCLFRSTLHRVLTTEQERYSVAFFLDGDPACMIECLESCCSKENPPRFSAIQCADYLQGHISAELYNLGLN